MTHRRSLLALAAVTCFSAAPAVAVPLYWDGSDLTPDADGGAGTWDTTTSVNWDSSETAGSDSAWPGAGTDNDAIFPGTGGNVVIPAGGVTANDLSFLSDGYTIEGGSLTLNNTAANTLTVADGVTAAISAPITATAGNVIIAGTGSLNLSGDYSGTGRNFSVSGARVNLSSPAFAIKKFIIGVGAGTTSSMLTLTSGTFTTSGDYVGVGDGVNGTVNVAGGNLTLAAGTTALFLGTNTGATGTLNISSGSVNVNSGPLNIGTGYNGNQTTSSSGILTLSGTGSYNHNSGSQVKLTNSANQTGTVNLLAGGTFSINGQLITKGAGNATFNFDGGTLRSLSSTPNYFGGNLDPVVNGGGAIVDTNGFNATIATNLVSGSGNGGLTKKGNGFLGLAGTNTYTGDTTIEGGHLIANVLGAIPAPEKVTVAAGAGYGVRYGGAYVGETDFLALMGAADFAPGTFVTFDTGGGNTILATDIGSATNIGSGIALAKVGTNTLTVDLSAQSFTGDISVAGGPLTLDTSAPKSYGGDISGNQTLNLQGGGDLTFSGSAAVGQFNKFDTGTFTLADGALTVAANQNFFVHDGTFHQTGGAMNSGSYSVIGRSPGLTGEYIVDGGIFNASGAPGVSRNTVIAEQGSTGILTINGGTVNATNSTGGSNIGGFYYGIIMAATETDNATLNLNGGTLLLSRIGSTFSPGTSTFNFNGGTLKSSETLLSFMQGLTRVNVRDGGAVIDTNGNDVAVYQDLRHSDIPGDAAVDGGLTKLGAGTLELDGYENDYSGNTRVLGGNLLMYYATLPDTADVTIAGGATLELATADTDTVRSLVIDGVPAAVGTWGSLDSVGADFTSAAILGDGLLNVTELATVSAYDSWAAGYGLSGADALPDADPDKDGTINAVEFALHGDPTDASDPGQQRALIQDASSPAGEELTLVVAVRDGATFGPDGGSQTATVDGVVYRIEGSLGLDDFDAAVSHVSVSETASGLPSLAGTEWEYHTFKLDASEGLSGKGFLRVGVELAP
ncbi:beta strand repeat-containing protein [Luteolibacter marinus]|uniref:beta strand repeat-containing protein n=1 Tax=Luteolibacter marinus TaxID=2776705 RepID=UPI0018668B00|nr:autotransporter-associated beta strand repeat-containing protein [Luteolibacter marinus]